MRHISIFILTLFLTSCFDNSIKFEKEYYERITQIKFPEKYKVLETFDNGEFVTGTVFQMDSLTLRNFVNENHFDTIPDHWYRRMMSEDFLVTNKPIFSSIKNLYFKEKSHENTSWTYIADLNTNRLWTEINYPDWSGK